MTAPAEVEAFPRYAPHELRGILEDIGLSDPVIDAELRRMEAEGRLTAPLVDPSAPVRLTLDDVLRPPAERLLLGRMLPLAKSSVVFGPTGAGKSAFLAQVVFGVAGGARTLFGLPVNVHGPVLIVTAEDSTEDWQRKAAAVHYGTEDIDVEAALGDVSILDLTEGEARLSEVVMVRDGETTRRIHRATELQERVVSQALEVDAVLILVETASRFVEDEDNASFSGLQSALGRIARETGAAVVITHHATKAASKENDNSIENARGGGSLVYNARNALTLFPAEPSVARGYSDRFAAADLFTLSHGKSTSSTKREDSITLARLGTAHGAIFARPEDTETTPEMAAQALARRAHERDGQYELLRRLYELVERTLPTRPNVSPRFLAEERHDDLGITKRRMTRLIETALHDGVLKLGKRSGRGVTLALGVDPRLPINAGANGAEEKINE